MDIHIPYSSGRKKKIAIFANGHNAENLYRFLDGLMSASDPDSVDYFLFLSHSLFSSLTVENKCMDAIYDLPDLSNFDAAILYSSGIHFSDVLEKLIYNLKESGLPVISIGLDYPGFYSISADNYSGMAQLCEHLITEHNVKKLMFIAGAADNTDSNERLKAVKDTMKAHNLPFTEDDIFYSNWEVGFLLHEINKMLENNVPMPDAFVCANDLLAETVTYAMEDNQYPNYDKQILTGFDFLEDYRAFYPSLASVDQQPDEMGRKAYEIINQVMKGQTVSSHTKIGCIFHPGESCGCQNTRNEEELRRQFARHAPRRFIIDNLFNSMFINLEKEVIHSENYHDLVKRLQNIFESINSREGSTFYIMLDHHFSNIEDEDISNLPKYRFADEMDVAVAKYNNEAVICKSIETVELLPLYDGRGANRLYTFLPAYYESFLCGYIVVADNLEWIKSKKFLSMENSFKGSIITYRRNMQLEKLNLQLASLMEKDSLTSVKNRTAYDRYVAALEKKISSNECSPFAIVCFDINNLKAINDQLGHEAGDEYIKNCCKFICNSFKHSPVFRIGGDEFVAILQSNDFEHRTEYMEQMRKNMDDLNHQLDRLKPTELISIASGLSAYDPTTSDTFSDIFKWADEKMYQNKYLMKNGRIR